MVLALVFGYLLGTYAPAQVDEVNVDVLGSQRLCHCRVYAVHDGVALGIHIAERAADKDFDVLIGLGHSRESIGG